MTVEIRQLLIKCEVRSSAPTSEPTPPQPSRRHQHMSRELLALLDRRIDEALRRARER